MIVWEAEVNTDLLLDFLSVAYIIKKVLLVIVR